MKDLSRRHFIQTAAAGVVATALPVAAEVRPVAAERHVEPVSALEGILERYGSEFGAVRRVCAGAQARNGREGN